MSTDFLEYNDPTGEPWRAEAGSALRQVFGIHGAEVEMAATLSDWHAVLAAQTELWPVVRRRFGVRPQFGVMDPREGQACSREELASELGRSLLDLEAVEAAAVKCWRMALAGRPALAALEPDDDAPPMNPDDAAELLRRHGFAEVGDEAERRYIAERIIGMSEVLESDSQRAVCRSMIIQEANLFFVIDPPIKALRDRIKRVAEANPDADQSKDNKQLMDMLAARGTAGDRLEKTMEALGISEKQTNSMRKRSLFQDSVSVLVEGIRLYRSREDNSLLDGIFRGAEIEVLTRPFDMRDSQYRPDLALTMPHAVAGLFDPDYKGPKFPRKVMRRLHLGFREGLKIARGEDGSVIAELDGEAGEEMLDEAEENAGSTPGGLPAGMRVPQEDAD